MSSPDQHWQIRAFRLGAKVTWATAAASVLYAAATWAHPHRAALLAVTLAAALDGFVVWRATGHDATPGRRMDGLMMAWNGAHVAAAVLMSLLDGGITSPYVSIFFISVGFAAVSLPRRRVWLMAGLDVAGLVAVVTLAGGTPNVAPAALWVAGLVVTAGVCASIAEDRLRRARELDEAREEMLRRLARVVEYRDTDTGGHVERIGDYCAFIAERLGFASEERRRLRLAATMHDIGKVAIPDAILLKPGPLTPAEREDMQRHAQVGHDMLAGSGSDLLDLAATIALTHHERYDGDGYPNGVRGADIPLTGRIVAVADVFDALTSDRVYKRAMPAAEAIRIIREGSGTQFDPAVVEAFLAELDAVEAVGAPGPAPVALAA